jgi:hypothetical protein
MHRYSWAVLAAALAAACGGGSHSQTNQNNDGGTAAGTYYSDVQGFDVPAGAERVPIGQWPSWLHEKTLVSACAAGEVFYGDRCWQSMVVDVDTGKVTFSGQSGETEVLALGAPLPGILGAMVLDPVCSGAMQVIKCYLPYDAGNTGYVQTTGPAAPGFDYAPVDVWGSPITPYSLGSPLSLSPWVLGSQVQMKDGNLSGFFLRMTFLYGFKNVGQNSLGPYEVVHNWSYQGHVTVSGQDLPLPVHLADVARATGVAAARATDGSQYIDLANRTIRFMSDHNVMDARKAYKGDGAGLSEDDLVTSVEFYTMAVQPL